MKHSNIEDVRNIIINEATDAVTSGMSSTYKRRMMNMNTSKSNLLAETLEAMEEHNLHASDISEIGLEDSNQTCTWDEFWKMANVEYYIFGTKAVPEDLVIVFKDGTVMRRAEFDLLSGRGMMPSWDVFFPPFFDNDSERLTSLFEDAYVDAGKDSAELVYGTKAHKVTRSDTLRVFVENGLRKDLIMHITYMGQSGSATLSPISSYDAARLISKDLQGIYM